MLENISFKTWLNKALTLIMAFIIAFTYMPVDAFAVSKDSPNKWKVKSIALFKNGEPKRGSDGDWYHGYTVYGYHRYAYRLAPTKGGKWVDGYCLEKDIMNPMNGNTKYQAKTLNGAKRIKSLSKDRKTGITLALLYGKQPDSTNSDLVKVLGNSVKGCNTFDWWIATQAIIWEFTEGDRKSVDSIPKNVSLSHLGVSGSHKVHFNAINQGRGTRPAAKIYVAMLKKMREHGESLSFLTIGPGHNKKPKNCKTIYMDEASPGVWKPVNKKYIKTMTEEERDAARQNSDYFVTLKDTKKVTADKIDVILRQNGRDKVQKNYKFTKKEGTSNWEFTYEGSKLPKNMKHAKKNVPMGSDNLLVFQTYPNESLQSIAIGADDPVDLWFKLRPVNSRKEPPKSDEYPVPEIYPTFNWPVHKDDKNPGWDGDTCTGMGDAPLNSTMDLNRKFSDEGSFSKVDSVTLDNFGSTEILSDTPWKELPEDEAKRLGDSSDDNLMEEPEETEDPDDEDADTGDDEIEADAKYLNKVESDKTCDKHGDSYLGKVEWSGEVDYEVEESALPEGRFREADSGTGNGIKTFHIKYYAMTENLKKCKNEDDNWSDITYRITVTDHKGRTEVISGTIDNDKIQKLGGDEMEVTFWDGGIFDESEEPLPIIWINDNYRGDLQIVKTLDDEDPFTDKTNSDNGVKKYSKNSKWTIELKSGGMENHPYIRVIDEGVKPAAGHYERYTHQYRVVRDTSGYAADPSHPLEVSEDGQIYVYDLPYGTYIVKEIAADNTSFVKEQFEITVSVDGQKISREINNQRKKNKIKVIKTNSETGKTVRWDADRTTFRIRYKGNPLLPDPTSSPSYNKYLPNGSNYTDKDENNYVFYANKNGEIVLPYQLEYGIYEIEELVVPEGYYVGQYDENGVGSIADMGSVNIINHEGEQVTPPKSFLETVHVRDAQGNKVTEFKGDNKTTYNTYRFTVLEQDDHMDGTDYVTYYATIKMPNNPAKGKIEITKTGEAVAGWKIGDIWNAVWDKIKLGSTKFEIYSAEDIVHSDGVIPVEAYNAADDSKIELEMTKRDHADVDDAKEVWQKDLNGSSITQVKDKGLIKDFGKANATVTDYKVKADKGASYKQEYIVRDNDKKLSYKYTVEYNLSYSNGGFNYTDVHVTKSSVSDEYVAKIEAEDSEPIILNGSDPEPLGFVTMNYDNGNMIRMNALEGEKTDEDSDENLDEDENESEAIGVRYGYNEDDIKAEAVNPKDYDKKAVYDETKPIVDEEGNPVLDEDGNPTYEQKVDDEGNPVFTTPLSIILPAGYEWCKDSVSGLPYYEEGSRVDGEGNDLPRLYMITKGTGDDKEYKIFVEEDGKKFWVPCTEDGKFYKSYYQEYNFTMVQHADCDEGFSLNWDDVIKMTAVANHKEKTTETVIAETNNTKAPEIKVAEGIYSYETTKDNTTIIGKPSEEAAVYFKNHDGIRTEMYLSGGLTHTRVTVSQSQIMAFNDVFPRITYKDSVILWRELFEKEFDPANDTYEKIFNDQNYLKAVRHETSPENKEVYYTIDIVSNSTDIDKGFKIEYPDTTIARAVASEDGKEGDLRFESIDDTMVYPIGKPVEVITTNSEGIAESSPLPLGDYWVREIASTNGHVNKGEWKKMTLEYKNQYTPLIWDTADYHNEAVSVKIDLDKLFETAYESDEYVPGSGAVFGIYTAEEMQAIVDSELEVDEKTIPADTLVGKLEVKDGHAETIVKLPAGRYYIKEISTPAGFKLNGAKYYFDAVDILTADQMTFHYKDIGVNGTVTQNGQKGLLVDFDVLYRYEPAKVTIDGKEYVMDTSFEDESSNVKVTVLDGRTNVQVKLNDGQNTTIEFENGAVMTYKAEGQTYTATVDGPAPTKLDTGADGNENFTRETSGSKTTIKYTPKVTKTNWLSEVSYKYVKPKDVTTGEGGWTEILPANKELVFTSPEGTSAVSASVDYAYTGATLRFQAGTVTSATVDGEDVTDLSEGIKLKRVVRTPVMIENPEDPEGEKIQKTDENGLPVFDTEVKETNAVINFEDGVTYTVQFDATGNFYMDASGQVDKNLELESTLTVDGSSDLPKGIKLKNTAHKTYARNNTNAGVLNITVGKIKNDRVPEEPTTPDVPTTPVEPEKPAIGTTAKDSETSDHFSIADNKVTIIDTVSYVNLVPGKEYTLKGVLMDKATGKPILVDGKEVTAEKVFTPEYPNGTVDVEFKFNGIDFVGKDTVVFEELYLNVDTDGDGKPDKPGDTPIADHKDIDDEGQTIKFYNPSYTMYKVRTTKAPSAENGKYGFIKGDKVSYDVYIINNGDVDLTMDVTDQFKNKDYFTIPVVKSVKNATWNNQAEGNANRANITVKAGETAIVTYQATVTAAKVLLAPNASDSDSLDKNKNDSNYRDEVNQPINDGWTNTAYTKSVTYEIGDKPGKLDDLDDPAQTPIREHIGKITITDKPNFDENGNIFGGLFPDTGDHTALFALLLILGASLAGIILIIKKRKSLEDKE